MTVYEALKFYKEPYLRLMSMGISTADFRFIDLYTEYLAMKEQGDKVTYIVAVLAARYPISERKVYKLLRMFNQDCNAGAV